MKLKMCFLFGHRDAPESVFSQLLESVYQCIQNQNIKEFVVGNRGNFDHLATQAVIKAKEKYPEIKLFLLISYYPIHTNIMLPQGFDGIYYPPDMEKVLPRFAIVAANRYVISQADYLIAYAWQIGSNCIKLVEYAKQKGIVVNNIAKELSENH